MWFNSLNCQNLCFNLPIHTIYSNKSLEIQGRSHRCLTERSLRSAWAKISRCSGLGPKRCPSCETESLKGAGSSAKRGCQGAGRQWPLLQLPREAACPLQPAPAPLCELPQQGWWRGRSLKHKHSLPRCVWAMLWAVQSSGLMASVSWTVTLFPSPSYQNFCVSDTTFTASSLWASFLYVQFCFTTISTWPW